MAKWKELARVEYQGQKGQQILLQVLELVGATGASTKILAIAKPWKGQHFTIDLNDLNDFESKIDDIVRPYREE